MSTRDTIAGEADANHLFDILLARYDMKNDAALCRHLNLAAPLLSKMRNGHQRVSAETMLRVHEAFGIPFAELRALLRCAPDYPAPRWPQARR